MRDDMRREVGEHLGEFLVAQGFQEIQYDYSEKFFGNEVLDLKSGDINLRFVRDRSQVWLDLSVGRAPFQPLNKLLRRLGVLELPSEDLQGSGFRPAADRLIADWPRLVALLRES